MRRSDVFESFVKIAVEKGLISEGEGAEQTEKSLDNPRWDSLSPEEIAKLYGHKPEGYKRNIIEQAHPESTVIAPSYDKLHGLVENENERQDITLNIIMQEPYGGHPNQRKYAEKELIMSLVRVGNDLDNRNLDELRVLADTCLTQVSLKKEGVGFLGVAISLAVLVAGIYAYQHITSREGLNTDINKLRDAIVKMKTSNANLVGFKFTDGFYKILDDLWTKVGEVYDAAAALNNAVGATDIPQTAQQRDAELAVAHAEKIADTPAGRKIEEEWKVLEKLMANYTPYFADLLRKLTDENFMQRNVADRGSITGFMENLGLEGENWYNLISTPFGELKRCLSNFVKDVNNLLQGSEAAEKDVADKAQQSQPAQAPKPPPAQTTPPAAQNQQGKAPWDSLKVPNSLEELAG